MKFKNKLLTVLPLTTIGVITPVVISGCSCGTSYTINYGDSINCSDDKNKTIAYHDVNDVKSSAKNHVQPNSEGEIKKIAEDPEFFYWDLVYSLAIKSVKFTLVWNDKVSFKNLSFNGTTYSNIEYKKDANNKWMIYGDSNVLIESYAYKNHA